MTTWQPDPLDPGVGKLAPGVTRLGSSTATLESSWRVWGGVGGRVPELYTVQVWRYTPAGLSAKLAGTWQVWWHDHWVGYWELARHVVGTRWLEDYPSLGKATSGAWGSTLVLGARVWQGANVVSCDAELPPSERDRWERLPVDPPPPWVERWPGPQPWRDQLTRSRP